MSRTDASHDDVSYDNIVMPPPSSSHATAPSDVSDIGTPEAPTSKRQTKLSGKLKPKKAPPLHLDASDLDLDTDDLDTSGESHPKPGRGQKTAVKRFAKLKGNLQAIVQTGDAMQAHFEARHRQNVVPPRVAVDAAAAAAAVTATIELDSDDDDHKAPSASSSRALLNQSAADDPFEEENYTVQVKVKWQSGPLERVPLRRYQPLADLCAAVSERHGGMPVAEILLMLNERIVRHEETLDSVGYTIGKYFCEYASVDC